MGQHPRTWFSSTTAGFPRADAAWLLRQISSLETPECIEMALENQAVERCDRAGYRIPLQITESDHVDLARVRWFTSSEIGATVSLKSIRRAPGRHRLWLRP
jgi:hypothetical protein